MIGRKPRRLEDTIAAMDCTPEVRARLLAKLHAARESSRRAIEAARSRRTVPGDPDDWIPDVDVAQRIWKAVEETRHEPAIDIAEALGMLEAFDSTKH